MSRGRNYSRKADPALSDLPMIWDNAASDWALTTFSDVLALFEANLDALDGVVYEPTSQYSIPVTGFNLQVTEGNTDIHVILTPAGTLSTGTITLPTVSGLRDKQIVMVNSTATITTLTIAGNGATLIGEPTTLAAEGYFTMKYDLMTLTWYRVA